jgi:hypothetical protein
MTANIYDQHSAAFSNVSAFVILGKETDDKGNPVRVATVALKFPKDGAGRLYAYVHWFGLPMVRGFAAGGGYDKRTAAVAAAIRNAKADMNDAAQDPARISDQNARSLFEFRKALLIDSGSDWTRQLQDVGFTVLQAV